VYYVGTWDETWDVNVICYLWGSTSFWDVLELPWCTGLFFLFVLYWHIVLFRRLWIYACQCKTSRCYWKGLPECYRCCWKWWNSVSPIYYIWYCRFFDLFVSYLFLFLPFF
jgi:hypothetical protein